MSVRYRHHPFQRVEVASVGLTEEKAIEACEAGADIVVVGNAVEKNPLLIKELVQAIK